MKRRFFIIGLVGARVLEGEEFDRNRFSQAYNEWVQLANGVAPGAVDVREWQAWDRVKEEWRKFQKEIDAEHRGK